MPAEAATLGACASWPGVAATRATMRRRLPAGWSVTFHALRLGDHGKTPTGAAPRNPAAACRTL